MNLTLRKPRLEDGESVHKLIQSMSTKDWGYCGGFPLSHTAREDFTKWIDLSKESEEDPDLKEHLFLTFAGTELVGFVRLHLAEELRDCGIVCYYVKPNFRGKGYGVRQMSTALQILKLYGVEKFTISVDKYNKPSKKIIKSLGGVFQKSVKGVQYYEMTT